MNFLPLLYGPTPWPGFLCRFDLPTYATSFHREPPSDAPNASADAYFGLGLLGREPATGRGTVVDVTHVPGAWADLDCYAGGPDKGAWLAALGALEHRPTAVVDSGTGLHAYWLASELVPLPDDFARARWKGVVQALQQRLRDTTGWTVDATHDMARVLRLPGSTHQRSGHPVRVLYTDGPRYSPDALWAWCPPERVQRRTAGGAAAAGADQWDAGELAEALEVLDADDYDTWILVGMGLRCLGEVGWRLWTEWASRSDKYSEQDSEKRWLHSFDSDGARGPGSVLHAARQKGWKSRADRVAAALLARPLAGDSTVLGGFPVGSDADLATVLHEHYPSDLAHVAGSWYTCEQGLWTVCEHPLQAADPIARDMHSSASRVASSERPLLELYAEAFACNRRAGAALNRAAGRMACQYDDFDSDPWVLLCASGLVDLRTGEQRPARAADRCTKRTALAYDPEATCPQWEQAVIEWCGADPDLVAWFQRWCGYCLTGSTSEHAFALWYGPKAGNGKSTALAVLRAVLGDYAQAADRKLFTTRAENHTTGMAALRGARLVEVAELRAGLALDVDRLKSVVSGDPQRARFMHRDEFEFVPSCKLIMTCNTLPPLSSVDRGVLRRAKVMGWHTHPRYPIKDYHKVLLESEGPGILAWCVRGAQEWHAHGLGTCDAIGRESSEWIDAEDDIGRFLRNETCNAEHVATPFGTLYDALARWAAGEGIDDAPSRKALSLRLQKEGYHKTRVAGAVAYQGIALGPADDEVPF